MCPGCYQPVIKDTAATASIFSSSLFLCWCILIVGQWGWLRSHFLQQLGRVNADNEKTMSLWLQLMCIVFFHFYSFFRIIPIVLFFSCTGNPECRMEFCWKCMVNRQVVEVHGNHHHKLLGTKEAEGGQRRPMALPLTPAKRPCFSKAKMSVLLWVQGQGHLHAG